MLYDDRTGRLIKCTTDGRDEVLVNVGCINYIDKSNRIIKIHCNYGIYNYAGTFTHLQEILTGNFVWADKGIIVNRDYVEKVFISELMLKDGTHIHVSKGGQCELNHHEVYEMNKSEDMYNNEDNICLYAYDDVSVNADKIIYVERPESEVIIHTTDNIYVCRGSLKKYEQILADCFIRIHNGYLINIKYIDYVTRKIVKMSNGDELPISQRRRPKIRRKLEEFVL